VAVPDYTGLFRFVYDWQTFIAGMGAIYGGWLAYRAGKTQATATREAARDQIAALQQQNAELKLADQRRLARERLAVAGLLYTSLGVVVGQSKALGQCSVGRRTVILMNGWQTEFVTKLGSPDLLICGRGLVSLKAQSWPAF
jgi:hypothetical protein